jgi:sterol desaturase/sphingolipid hydroxylase (fatty acid hydroxylase superfamily)
MDGLIEWLRTADLWQAVAVLLLENLLIFGLAVALGAWLVRRYSARPVALPPHPLEPREIAVAASSVVLNTVVTVLGLFLWRAGIVRFRTDVGAWAWLDVLVLLLIMDFAMYFLHRLAHHPWIFPLMHRLHHVYDRPRPLTLFILNPVENLAFGGLWLVVISLYHASWLGMSIYLALNVLFGMVGHLGVEPLPSSWVRLPGLRWIAGSTFHARHHQDRGSCYGFYTVFWDWLFGTLRPDYWSDFGKLPAWVSATPVSSNIDAAEESATRSC